MRSLPAGVSLSSLNAANPSWMPSKCGPIAFSNRSPASVVETLRVVRISSRTPSRCSSALTV
jgi:hypothetical protein